jgi:hypothetical protein
VHLSRRVLTRVLCVLRLHLCEHAAISRARLLRAQESEVVAMETDDVTSARKREHEDPAADSNQDVEGFAAAAAATMQVGSEAILGAGSGAREQVCANPSAVCAPSASV